MNFLFKSWNIQLALFVLYRNQAFSYLIHMLSVLNTIGLWTWACLTLSIIGFQRICCPFYSTWTVMVTLSEGLCVTLCRPKWRAPLFAKLYTSNGYFFLCFCSRFKFLLFVLLSELLNNTFLNHFFVFC